MKVVEISQSSSCLIVLFDTIPRTIFSLLEFRMQLFVKGELNKFLKNPKNIKNKGMRCIITKYNLLTHGKHSISPSSSLFLLENLCFLFFSKEGFLQLSCDIYVFKRLWVTAMFTFLQDFLTDF